MKYIAAIIVAIAFFLYYWHNAPKQPEPKLVHASPRPGELSEVEKEYYVKVFNYAMEILEAEQSYDWRSSDVNFGKISAEKIFTSKSSATCRNYSETFTVGNFNGKSDGVACKRAGDEGWCRLKKTDALTCALEATPYLGIGTPNMPVVNYSTPSMNHGIGPVGAPDVNVNTPNMPDAPKTPSGGGVADTVTGTAGKAAGPVTGGAIHWFSDTFLR